MRCSLSRVVDTQKLCRVQDGNLIGLRINSLLGEPPNVAGAHALLPEGIDGVAVTLGLPWPSSGFDSRSMHIFLHDFTWAGQCPQGSGFGPVV